MNLDYYLLPLALICLWMPAVVMSSKAVKEKLRQSVRRHEDGFLSLFRSRVNWIDLVRGAAGAWLVQLLVQHQTSDFRSGEDDLRWVFTCLQIAILFIGVVMQTVWIDQKARIIGPVFYLTGLTLIASGFKVGSFALILGFACALMLRRLSYSFLVLPVSLAAFGALFHQLGLMTAVNAGLFAFPLVLAFASDTRLSYVRRPITPVRRAKAPSRKHERPVRLPAQEEVAIPSKEMVLGHNFSSERPFNGAPLAVRHVLKQN